MVDKALVGILLQEGGKIISEIIRIRPIHFNRPSKPSESISQEIPGEGKVEVITLKSSIEEKVVDVKTGCVPCMPPESLIWGNPELKQINTLAPGKSVMGANGEYSAITQIMERHFTGDLISITIPHQNEPILLTPEHPVLAIKGIKCKIDRQTLCFPKENPKCTNCEFKKYHAEFTAAGDLSTTGKRNSWSKHIVLMPRLSSTTDINQINTTTIANIKPPFIRNKIKESIAVDEHFMKLAGYYLAEGSVNFGERGALFRLDFGPHEKQYTDEVVDLIYKVFGIKAKCYLGKTSRRVYVSSIILGHFFSNLFGSGAANKRIPSWLLTLPTEKQKMLLYGYWLGDGSFHTSYNRQVMAASTSSQQLAFGLRIILHRLGILHNLTYTKTKPSQIDGRVIVSGRKHYIIQVNSNGTVKLKRLLGLPTNYRFVQSSQVGIDENFVYLPVKNVEKVPYSGPVFNLETESGTYCASGIIVHNCAIGHLGTCTGLLNEGMRFARHDGLNNIEVIDRMNKCLDELNAMERVDLDSEKIAYLPDNEKKLALTALEASRSIRHNIENISSVDELEKITAETQTVRMAIGRIYFQDKLSKMPADDQAKVVKQLKERAEELKNQERAPEEE